MNSSFLAEIITLCQQLDMKAAEVYTELTSLAETPELQEFWQKMAAEERTHVKFWEMVTDLEQCGVLPQFFDDPETIIGELRNTSQKIELLRERCRKAPDVGNQFILAFRVEFYLLHPVFETFFHFVNQISEEPTPEDHYEDHLNNFIAALNRWGSVTPELELVGETLTRLWHENKLLAIQSFHDPLTDVMNRRGFFATIPPLLHYAQRRGLSATVMMIDIDDFKSVNDRYGHQKGDEVIKGVAHSIRTHTRGSDLVGRYGGEEFIVFLLDVNGQKSLAIAEKIRAYIAAECFTAIPVTASIGCTTGMLGNDVDKEIVSLIARADSNLLRAKNGGKNRVAGDASRAKSSP
jgi:diguanylate cyclase (GGDEF)-like protein